MGLINQFRRMASDDYTGEEEDDMVQPAQKPKKGLINRFRKKDDDFNTESEGEGILMKAKKHTMKDVLQCTVLETILNDFHKVKISKIYYEEDDMFIGLRLKAEDIGGINKKSPKDVSEMIQVIEAGNIKAYISEELLEREEILFVPDEETWENIGEYQFMRDANYTLQIIDEEGMIYDTEQEVTYQEIEDSIKNQKKLSLLIKEKEEPVGNEEKTAEEIEMQSEVNTEPIKEEEPQETNESEAGTEEASDNGEDQPGFKQEEDAMMFMDQLDNPESLQGMQYTSNTMDEISNTFENVTYTDEHTDDLDEEEEEDEYYEEITEVDEENIENTILRKFYSNDLDLEVSLDPFYSEFVSKTDIIPFKTDRPAGWLNEQLNEKSILYNQEIEQLHQSNIKRLRILYSDLMKESVQHICLEVDVNTKSNFYGQKYNELVEKKNNFDIEGEIEKYKQKLADDWEEKLQKVGLDAANMAMQKYREKYERQHEDEIYTADTYLRDKLEFEFQDKLKELNAMRKMKAQELLERHTDSVLKAVADSYLKMQDEEEKRIKEIQRELDVFLDNNRKDDIAMTQVREKEQYYKSCLEEQLSKHREEIEEFKKQLEEKEKYYKNELEQSECTHKRVLSERDEVHKTETEKLKNENIDLKKRYEELNEKFQNLEKEKEREYENQFSMIKNTNTALEEEVRVKTAETKRKTSEFIILAIVMVIAALAIGFMVGTVMSSPKTTTVSIEEQ